MFTVDIKNDEWLIIALVWKFKIAFLHSEAYIQSFFAVPIWKKKTKQNKTKQNKTKPIPLPHLTLVPDMREQKACEKGSFFADNT